MKITSIKIAPVPGTTIAESKDEARSLREQKILPAMRRGGQVEIDFGAVGFTTQSFVHALLSEPIRTYGEHSFDQISFTNCSPEVREVILTVFEYTIAAADVASDPDMAVSDETAGL